MSNRNLLIIGAGGHGRVVYEAASEMQMFDRIDFLDDNSKDAIGKIVDFEKFTPNYSYGFVALGDNNFRKDWLERLLDSEMTIPIIIHPTAYISPSVKIEKGTVVCAKAVLNTNSTIGVGCIISAGSLIDHDCHIKEYVHVNTGAIVSSGQVVKSFKKLESGIVFKFD